MSRPKGVKTIKSGDLLIAAIGFIVGSFANHRSRQVPWQVALRYFVGQEGGTRWGLFMAATVFVSLPVMIFYFVIQRSFVEGIATTGLKGA